MNVFRTDGKVLQYNDVADQFVVVWLGIAVIIIFSGVRIRIGAAIL